MSLVSLENTITLAMSVRDRHASARWYQEMLGFELVYHADEAGWSEIQTRTKDVTIGFGEQAEPAPGNCVPVFGVADMDSARQALETANVTFDGPTDVIEGMVKTATFYDPDGNALMLAQDLTGSA
ncbi:VOC family protein [Tropicibacter sp. Alg240-R139]|uniref:VOC family protein n=1 Tax=Tropicibacter sp. Alg240-R139 TaxID=2305991 RepID=UPI0013DF0D57|nr:VOC family protein [Tropicibacter sp. Alg240-R139]